MKAVVPCYIGVDVSKVQLDIAVHTAGQVWQVANGPASIMELVVELQALAPDLVAFKTTRSGDGAGRVLAQAHLPVVVVNPRQVRDFAKV